MKTLAQKKIPNYRETTMKNLVPNKIPNPNFLGIVHWITKSRENHENPCSEKDP